MRTKLLLSILLVSFLIGCRDGHKTEQVIDAPDMPEVIIPKGAAFPRQMVGVWENKQNGWILRIEENGRLSKIRHTIGRRDLTAGQRSEFQLFVDRGKGFIQPGPWQVEYLAKTNEIVIDISLESFRYDLSGGAYVSGSSRDIFVGEVPQLGESIWKAVWINKPNYVATTVDKRYEDYQLPFEQGDEDRGEIVFEKIDIEYLKE